MSLLELKSWHKKCDMPCLSSQFADKNELGSEAIFPVWHQYTVLIIFPPNLQLSLFICHLLKGMGFVSALSMFLGISVIWPIWRLKNILARCTLQWFGLYTIKQQQYGYLSRISQVSQYQRKTFIHAHILSLWLLYNKRTEMKPTWNPVIDGWILASSTVDWEWLITSGVVNNVSSTLLTPLYNGRLHVVCDRLRLF